MIVAYAAPVVVAFVLPVGVACAVLATVASVAVPDDGVSGLPNHTLDGVRASSILDGSELELETMKTRRAYSHSVYYAYA